MATIGFIQHRLGSTDGVSLEVEKFRLLLEKRGHRVRYLSGNDTGHLGRFIPELHPSHPDTARIIRNATRKLTDYPDGEALIQDIRVHADRINPGILAFLEEESIDLLFPNNLLSVGYNLPGALALTEALESTGIQAVCHHHDFWWEDSGEVFPTCAEVIDFYSKYCPPALPNLKHCVINSIAQGQLFERCGLESRVIPNVFDFDRVPWERDSFNQDLRKDLGLEDSDLLFLQATRVLDRKGIELAIDTVAQVNAPENLERLISRPLYNGRRFSSSSRTALVCAGYVESIGISGDYATKLAQHASEKGVDLIWASDKVGHTRHATESSKRYSLWDCYTAADFVTYPSVWEGWGNQLIEAIFARLPVLLFEYPVYQTDLVSAGFKVVSLGSSYARRASDGLLEVENAVLRRCALEIVDLLQDPNHRRSVVNHNVLRAKEYYSYHALDAILGEILESQGIPQTVC